MRFLHEISEEEKRSVSKKGGHGTNQMDKIQKIQIVRTRTHVDCET